MQYSKFGALVVADPQKAHSALVTLFVRHKQRAKVAEAIGSDDRTVGKWIKLLEQSGLPDPRTTARAKGSGVKERRAATLSPEQKARARLLRPRHTLAAVAELLGGVNVGSVARACRGVAGPGKPAKKT